jgi:hypothetical protein
MRQPREAAWPVNKPEFYLTDADARPGSASEGDVQGGAMVSRPGHTRPPVTFVRHAGDRPQSIRMHAALNCGLK